MKTGPFLEPLCKVAKTFRWKMDINIIFLGALSKIWSNGVMVNMLDSQCRYPAFKTTGCSKVDPGFHIFEVNKMSTRSFWELSGKK